VTTGARRTHVVVGPAGLAALLLAIALVAWIVTIDRMDGMDAGPGTDLGALGWYVGVWVTMMAAMMLPSAAPTMLMFARMARAREGKRAAARSMTVAFVGGYLAVWTAFGLFAYGLFEAIRALGPSFLAWDAQGPLVAGAAVTAAGVYQLSPLKRVCLRHCRSPLHFLMHAWRPGELGALRLGIVHGGYCVGCCAGLMVILFALGVMSVLWMAVIAAVIFSEKILPFGFKVRTSVAVALVALGIWIAAAPTGVPGLHQPDAPGGMPMMSE
jgi:predicted metal-binding membrane protein